MTIIIKLFRVIFFYALFFVLCMFAVVVALQNWSIGYQMIFAFGLPVLLVWWQERRRVSVVRVFGTKGGLD
ncbi:hypothetical protein [Yoonia sp. MH D7]